MRSKSDAGAVLVFKLTPLLRRYVIIWLFETEEADKLQLVCLAWPRASGSGTDLQLPPHFRSNLFPDCKFLFVSFTFL